MLTGRMSRWALLISEYDVKLVTPTTIKSQALADLLSICPEKATIEELPNQIPGIIETIYACNEEETWTLMFDGTPSNPQGGAGVVLTDSHGRNLSFMFRLDFSCTNNEAEYEALMLGLKMAQEVGIKKLHVKGDSNLIIQQILEGYGTKERSLALCREQVWRMMKVFDKISFEHVPRTENKHADALATLGSRVTIQNGQHTLEHREKKKGKKKQNNCMEPLAEKKAPVCTEGSRGEASCKACQETKESMQICNVHNWQQPIVEYLDAGFLPSEKIEAERLKKRSKRYFLQKGRCNQLGQKVCTIPKACKLDTCAKRAEEQPQNTIPIPYMGGRFCGTNQPPSMEKKWILVATESFTKWVEAVVVREANAEAVVRFIKENIICRFGLPSVLVSDNGTHFVNQRVWGVLEQYQIKHHKSSPYYPQGNGQAEATDKSLLKILTKMVTDAHKDWSEYLPLALWAYRTTRQGTTGVTPFSLVYGVEVVLPTEIEVPTTRMLLDEARDREAELQELEEKREVVGSKMEEYHRRLALAYDKHVQPRVFLEGDLVLKSVDVVMRKMSLPKWAPK
ncbi:uncharacterized protein LOC107620303 [Arachis ipaensis]|uniref:uncharacterized protein LOC107620303 n=1 Tax=Arachis ipaensis TaxID=130454 RepID=UPI0007AF99BD|nr:uncharacterized protein LOC107620303 [Arachis ipaensis]XP_025684817.1 uncharacterized protein LOC112785572 [Arachis hypogaea]